MIMISNDVIKFIKFSIVGITNTIVSLVSFYLLFEFLGVYYIFASTIGYFMGLVNSYFWNLRWTFKHRHSTQILIKFIIVNILALGFKLINISIFIEIFNILELYSEVLAMIIAIVINFGGNRYWTFKER